jgi:hypothetical protein
VKRKTFGQFSARLLMVSVLVDMNRLRPEPVGGHDVEVGAGLFRLCHPSQRGVALACLDLLLVGIVLLLQVLEVLHLRHARERLRPALVIPRQPRLPASFRAPVSR